MEKRKVGVGVDVTFVGNDDVMAHIIDVEEVSAKKARKNRVQRLASSATTPSRPVRSSRKSVNYSESIKKEGENNSDKEEIGSRDSLDSDEEDKTDRIPEVLLDRDGLLGTEVYSFKTPKRSGKMAVVAAESVDRRHVKRHAVKRRQLGREKNDSDFSSGQSSDDNEDDDDYEADKDDLNSDSSSERSVTMARPRRAAAQVGTNKTPSAPKQADAASNAVRRSSKKSAKGGVSTMPNMAEEYFVAHSGQAVTSDHTLSRLENPQMGDDQLKEALENAPNSHTEDMAALFREHSSLFKKWMYHLSNDYNILLYGLGSKRRLLEAFRNAMLREYTHIIVNGYFPSLTIRSILNAISDDVIDDGCHLRNVMEQMEFIEDKLEERDEPLFLIIHNLDGSMLRGTKVQSVLSRLAQIPNLHILASMDHINAPLIWDQERSSTFRWLWYDATTFDPYTDETSYENSLLVQQSGMLALSSLTHVLRSLTPNARGIFNILVEFQLEHKDDGAYNGLSFQDLYQKCREAFLVNSDLTLRAQLTEFRDHKLIRSKKSLDGMELLTIPLDNSTLLEFQQQEEL